jgi:long-chain fatty acid transport protein
MVGSIPFRCCCALALGVILTATHSARAQFGVVLSGAGPENRAMGGASTAAPLDPSGALYWNPATITGLPGSQVGFGLEVLFPHSRLSSSVPAGALGGGIPPVPLAGSDRSDAGAFLLPTIGVVYQPDESSLAFGLGIFSAGGFAVNYPASTTNPILTPQPPKGIGLGALSSELQVFQIAPTVALKLTDRLSVGFAPTLNLATLTADPALLASPDDADRDGFPTYPAATHGRVRAGGGFQAGVYYSFDSDWHFGASIKSPQWFETFSFNGVDELGRPRPVQFRFDYPLMASLGTAYTGIENLTLAADFHYIDYRNTVGFSQSGFDRTGALRGLGWDSVFALAVGAEYELTPCATLRLGYTFNTNPVRDERTIFNVGSPLLLEHGLYLGASYKIAECFRVSVAYAHGFDNSIRGPIVSPLGTIPGSSVQSLVSADTVLFGATFKF